MKHYVRVAKAYASAHKNILTNGALVILVIAVAALFVYTTTPHYTYQPVKACDLLTPAEAQDLLGDHVINVDTKAPVVSDSLATSKCSYTDSPAETDIGDMMVAAVAVRSAVEDEGIAKNKTDFAAAKANNDVEDVKDVGDSAYFNKTNGQLNILDGRSWIILNYGAGSAPETNTVDKAVELAHKVLL